MPPVKVHAQMVGELKLRSVNATVAPTHTLLLLAEKSASQLPAVKAVIWEPQLLTGVLRLITSRPAASSLEGNSVLLSVALAIEQFITEDDRLI